MKRTMMGPWRLALLVALFGPVHAAAQEPAGSTVDSLRRSLREATERLDSLEAGRCPGVPLEITLPARSGQAATDSLVEAMRRVAERVRSLESARCRLAPSAADTSHDDLASLRAAAAGAVSAADSIPGDSITPGPPEFVSRQRNLNIYNPEISATGDVRLVAREGRQEDNFVAREFEFAFQSSLDPYSATKVFLTFEDEEVGVEEGYIYYSGLPGRLRLDLGKIRQQVGDLNRWHLHALPEGEYPLVYRRYFGEEGLAGVGLSLYTVLPFALAGGTHELWLQGTRVESDPLTAGGGQPAGLVRLQNFWQLTRSTYAQLGATALWAANADSSLQVNTQGLDFRLTWRPPNAGTRRDLTIRVEAYRFHAREAGLERNRFGGFADLQLKLDRRWTVGGRYDYVEAPRGPWADEWQLTPVLTWWQSEFVYLRLQAQHRRELDGSTANDLTFQVVWAMGPHKHETY